MIKKVLKIALYCVVIFVILVIGAAILIPIDSTETEKEAAKVVPESSAGSIHGANYYHPPSGWRFMIPDGWKVQDPALAQKSYEESKKIIESSTGENIQQSAKSLGELALIHSPGNTLNFKYQKYDKKRFPEFEQMVQFLNQTLSASYQQSVLQNGNEVKVARSKVDIGKIDFDNLQFTILDPQTKNILATNQIYVAEINDHAAMISFSCRTRETCSALYTAVGASLFDSMLSDSLKLFHSAVYQLDGNNAPEAYRLLSQALEIEPNHAFYYMVRADAASRIEGYMDKYVNDLEKAEQLTPQLPEIYHLRATLAKQAGAGEQYYFNAYKSNLFNQLISNGIHLPKNTFGITEGQFAAKAGNIGYIQSGLTLDFQETLPIPRIGGKSAIVFKKLEIIDGSGVVKCSDALPVNEEGYEITAYNLLTAFEDSSGQFYQLYYQVKYKDN